MTTPFKIYELFVPEYEKLKSNIVHDLIEAFEVFSCEIVDCPDLTQEPFLLSGKGLCGNPMVADVGKIENLVPIANRNKKYDFKEILADCNLANGFICGAGAGPFYEVGVNCELVVDAEFRNFEMFKNKSMIAKLSDNKNISFSATSSNFGILGQFLCCEGASGKVLKITAEKRKQSGSILVFLQNSLNKNYGTEEKPVGLGGVILVKSGNSKIHVMPDFSDSPLIEQSAIDSWLQYFEVPAPFIAVGEMVSHDPLGLNIRLQHFHGFTGDRKMAGHFHQDVSPEEVKYEAYFVICEKLLKKDP